MRPKFPTLNDPNDPQEMFKYASLSAHTWTSQGLGLWWTAVFARRGNVANLVTQFPNGDWLPGMSVQPAELMLRGMAIECMLKAIYLFETQAVRELTVDEFHRRPWWRRHDLRSMADEAKVEISREEREMLGWLSGAIQWWGRYPTPKQSEEFGPAVPRWQPFRHDPTLDALWNRVSNRAHQWSSGP